MFLHIWFKWKRYQMHRLKQFKLNTYFREITLSIYKYTYIISVCSHIICRLVSAAEQFFQKYCKETEDNRQWVVHCSVDILVIIPSM
jgi:recombinational DNA repair protein (RecF pathway)